MARMWKALLPLLLFAVLAGYFGVQLVIGRNETLPSALLDRPVPAVELPPLRPGDARGFGPQDLTGQVHLVNVFASWCVPCRAEHPLLMALGKEGVPIIGINYRDKPGNALAWLASLGDPYRRIGVDPEGKTAIEWGVYGVPETFVVDKTGRIRHKHVGVLTQEVVDKTIRPLVRELSK